MKKLHKKKTTSASKDTTLFRCVCVCVCVCVCGVYLQPRVCVCMCVCLCGVYLQPRKRWNKIWVLLCLNAYYWWVSLVSFVCVCVCVCFFRAALEAYGGSQARGKIGAVATGLYHSSRQCWIFNPLSEARDRTCNLMVPSWIRFCCATIGTPYYCFFLFLFKWPHLQHTKFPSQKLNLCCSFDLCHSYGNVRAFNTLNLAMEQSYASAMT